GALGTAHAGQIEDGATLSIGIVFGRNSVEIVRLTLGLEVTDDLFHLLVGNERTVNAANAPTANHVQHVALTEELLGTLFAQDRAAVDPRCDLEGNAGGKICLDRAGDYVNGWPLRR